MPMTALAASQAQRVTILRAAAHASGAPIILSLNKLKCGGRLLQLWACGRRRFI
jgi:hypothetical protein